MDDVIGICDDGGIEDTIHNINLQLFGQNIFPEIISLDEDERTIVYVKYFNNSDITFKKI
jgi:hypothetical protein